MTGWYVQQVRGAHHQRGQHGPGGAARLAGQAGHGAPGRGEGDQEAVPRCRGGAVGHVTRDTDTCRDGGPVGRGHGHHGQRERGQAPAAVARHAGG